MEQMLLCRKISLFRNSQVLVEKRAGDKKTAKKHCCTGENSDDK